MGERCGGAKRSKHRFGCPNASSEISMQTPEKSLRFFLGNLRCRNQSAARAAHSIWAFIPIHVDLPISSLTFFFIVIEPGCYRSFLFVIWLNSYRLV